MAEWSIKCPQCGSTELFLKSKGSALGAYCTNCGRWIKWVNKKEENLIRQRAKKMVAIKNMEMPKCCRECDFKYYNEGENVLYCALEGGYISDDEVDDKRLECCPLVEVRVQED